MDLTPLDHGRRRALENLLASVNLSRRFPDNVFSPGWSQFLFFDPDQIFQTEFPRVVDVLLAAERGSCACMSDLYRATADANEVQSFFFMNMQTTGQAYMRFLEESGWVFRMDRFSFGSDVGRWSIYTERSMEFAVLAIRDNSMLATARPAVERIGALRIEKAIEDPPSYGLTSIGLTPEWRQALLANYTTPSSSGIGN